MPNNILDSFQISGSVYDLKDKNSPSITELTQQEYDNLPSSAKTSNTLFLITDAEGGDLSNYYTKSETSGATQISTALDGKQATLVSGTNIKTINNESILGSGNINIQGGGGGVNVVQTTGSSTTDVMSQNAVTTQLNEKQATLVSGTNIKTINNESILGSGNIDIQGGGGTSYTAGRGIDITNNTISFNLPISAGTGNYSIIEGASTSAMSYYDHAEGYGTYAKGEGYAAHAEGYQTSAMTFYSHAEGRNTKASGESSHAEGKNTVASGESSHAEGRNTVVSGNYSHAEGYGTSATSISDVSFSQLYYGYQARHAEGCNTKANNGSTHTEGYFTEANNFGEHASGVYNESNSATTTFGDSGNTLFSVGNGNGNNARHNAFEIRQNGDIYCSDGTNDVKLQDTITATAANTTALGGLKLVKLSQAEYDSLSTKDSNTLFVIV